MAENKTIEQLPLAGPLTGAEKIPVFQDGETKQTTGQAIAGLLSPRGARFTTGDYELQALDNLASTVSQDTGPVNLFIPAGLPAGFRVRSYQGDAGQVSYVPAPGVTILDGILRSLGRITDKYFVDIEHLGDDLYIITGNTTPGLQNWSLIGPSSVGEGDPISYIFWRPDVTANFPDGVSLKVTGTGFNSAGLDLTVEQALANLAALNPNVSFDGVNTLTIKAAAPNPLPLFFFVKPDYATTSDRSVTLTISDPTIGEVGQGGVTTLIKDTSRPLEPTDILPLVPYTVAANASSGQNQIALTSTDGIELYGTVTATGIPAQTWVTAINGNTITLSSNLTGAIAAAATINHRDPGIWFDFSTSVGTTLDGSNKCALVTEKLNGYTLAQATQNNKPTFVANALNGLGGLDFSRTSPGNFMTGSAAPLYKPFDNAAQKYTIIAVVKLKNQTLTGYYWGHPRIGASANVAISAWSCGSGYQTIPTSQGSNIPYIWCSMSDGSVVNVRCNGNRALVPATLTADLMSGTSLATVDDISNIYAGQLAYFPNTLPYNTTIPDIQGVNDNIGVNGASGNVVTLNQNAGANIPTGTTIFFHGGVGGGSTPVLPTFSTTFVLGADANSLNKIDAVIHEIIIIPKLLSLQQWRGLHARLSQKWATTFTQTAASAASQGSLTIELASVSNVAVHQNISGTGIAANATVVKVNATTRTITLDKALTGSVSSGATLTFQNCAFKRPDLLDLGPWSPTFRDDFANGVQFSNSGPGWQPYYGDVTSPGNTSSTYGAAGHGSSNNGSVEQEWYLDVLNYLPWLKYNPFGFVKDDDAPTGAAVITASPTPAEIANLVGYIPPQPSAYPYIAGYIKSRGAFYQQYGYFEARMKITAQGGSWPAWWLTAADVTWPPEIDIIEAYGPMSDTIFFTTHHNKSFSPGSPGRANQGGEIQLPITEQYVLLGVNVTPETVDFYINREKVSSVGTRWDYHTPWIMQANVAVKNGLGAVTEAKLFLDYVGVWQSPRQAPAVPTGTQAETTALVSAMSVAPSSGRRTLINTVIAKLKAYKTTFGVTLWDQLDFLYMTAAHDEQAARVNWKNPAQVGTPVGIPTFINDRGYTGSKDVSYIDTGINISSGGLGMTVYHNHIGGFVRTLASSNGRIIGSTNLYIIPSSGMTMTFSNFSTVNKKMNTVGGAGHYLTTRNRYHLVGHYNGGFTAGRPQGSSNNTLGPDNENLRLANGASQVACAHGGGYLTPDDVEYLYAILNEYMVAVGAM